MVEQNEDLSWMLEPFNEELEGKCVNFMAAEIEKSSGIDASKDVAVPNLENHLPNPKTIPCSSSAEKEPICGPSASTVAPLEADLNERYKSLQNHSEKNQEILRKLKLVKCHQRKNNLETLDKLIKKWRSACRDALSELMEYSSKHQEITMRQLIQHLAIDPSIVRFDMKADAFLKETATDKKIIKESDS